MDIFYLTSAILLILTAYIFRFISILPFYRTHPNDRILTAHKGTNGPLHIFVFLGSGGHTGEMLRILQNYKETLLNQDNVLYVGYSDIDSRNKFSKLLQSACKVEYIEFKKAREVNSGLLASLKSIFLTLMTSLLNVIRIRKSIAFKPHLILLNGPGTCCIPVSYTHLDVYKRQLMLLTICVVKSALKSE